MDSNTDDLLSLDEDISVEIEAGKEGKKVPARLKIVSSDSEAFDECDYDIIMRMRVIMYLHLGHQNYLGINIMCGTRLDVSCLTLKKILVSLLLIYVYVMALMFFKNILQMMMHQ